ncbi:MAG: DUF3137 domain-containing protein [Candidatus Izemoplasma sp.]
MENKIAEFQRSKSAAEKKIIIGGLVLILGILIFIINQNLIILAIPVGITGIVFLILGYSRFNKMNHEFKLVIMKDLIEDFVDNGHYDPKAGLSARQVYDTEFIKHADRFHTEDYVSGSMDGVDFISSDVKLEERHVRRTKNGTQTYYITYFMGRIFRFEFNKNFDGYLQVLEGGRPQVKRNYNKVKLESVVFNKKFKTYSSNDHSAFYVLTPHFMESLMKFEKENKGKISFSFIDNMLYIGISNMRDTFELKMFTAIDKNTVSGFKQELLVIKEVIDELKLNRNIFK